VSRNQRPDAARSLSRSQLYDKSLCLYAKFRHYYKNAHSPHGKGTHGKYRSLFLPLSLVSLSHRLVKLHVASSLHVNSSRSLRVGAFSIALLPAPDQPRPRSGDLEIAFALCDATRCDATLGVSKAPLIGASRDQSSITKHPVSAPRRGSFIGAPRLPLHGRRVPRRRIPPKTGKSRNRVCLINICGPSGSVRRR
jgi:hypothetical protein